MDDVGGKEEGDMKKIICIGMVAVLFVAVVTLTARAKAEPVTPETNSYLLMFYDGHMHTTFSDGNGTVSDIVATARSRGLDAVIITDHSEDLTLDEWNWLVGNCSLHTNATFLCLPGFEMTGNESIFMRDHFNVYNVSSPFVNDTLVASEIWPSPFNPNGTGPLSPENITNWVNWAHSQGGFVVHNHPTGHTKTMYDVDCIEIWNQDFVDTLNEIGEQIPPFLGGPIHGAGYLLNNLAIYGERDLTSKYRKTIYDVTLMYYGVGIWIGSPEDPLNSWDSYLLNYAEAQDYVLFAVGGTDTHNSGNPDSKVGLAKTGVYVNAFTANDLYEGIKKGRSFVTTGPIVSFNISDTMMGETLFLTRGVKPVLNVKIESSGPSANITQVKIIKNGFSWQTFNPNQTSFETQINDTSVAIDSVYRIEVAEYDSALNKTHYAYSNPIFVKPPLLGDVIMDGTVDIFDVVIVAAAFGSRPVDPEWDMRADLRPEFGLIDIFDFMIVAAHFGESI